MASGTVQRSRPIEKTFISQNTGTSGAVMVPSTAIVSNAYVVGCTVKGITNVNHCLGIYFEYGDNRTPFVKVFEWESMTPATNASVEITLYYL